MAATEPAEVYVIHLLRRLSTRVNLTGTIPLRFMPRSLAAIRTWFVQSSRKMTREESDWKSTDTILTGGKPQVPRRFDRATIYDLLTRPSESSRRQ